MNARQVVSASGEFLEWSENVGVSPGYSKAKERMIRLNFSINQNHPQCLIDDNFSLLEF